MTAKLNMWKYNAAKFLLIVLIAGHIFESLLCPTERCYEGLWGFGAPVPRLLSKETSIHIKLFLSQSSSSTSSAPRPLKRNFYSYKPYTTHLLFSTPPVFPFKLGNGSFIRTLNFLPQTFVTLKNLSPILLPPNYPTVDRLQFPF